MSVKVSRRHFLKASSIAAGIAAGAAVSGTCPSAAQANLLAKAEQPYDESRFTTCDMCFNRCGVVARLREGRVVKLDPNPHFTKSRGMLCARGIAGLAQVYDKDRLTTPLLRVGKRGEGKWKPIGWDEALKLAAERFLEIGKKHTRCGVMFSAGADMQTTFCNRLAAAFGSFNTTTQESLCLFSMHRAYLDTFGEIPMPDLKHCKYVLMPGSNRFESLVTPDSTDLMDALRTGAKLCVVDPRPTKTALLATDWLCIRPGTDISLALGLMRVLLTENRIDSAWVAEHCFGLDELRAHVEPFTPERVSADTGLDPVAVVRVARDMAAAAPAALVYPGRRTSDYTDSTQMRRAWAILNGLLGNFDHQGGLLVPAPIRLKSIPLDAPWYDDNPEFRADEQAIPLPFKEEGAFMPLRETVLSGKPYPIKGWLTFKTNPLQTAPDRARSRAMAESMDFMVCLDIQMSDTAFMSDLVLPCHSYLERQDPVQMLSGGPAGSCLVWREPVVEPAHNTRNPFDIFKGLATHMGLAEHFDFTIEQFRTAQLSGLPAGEQPTALAALTDKGVYHPDNQTITGRYPQAKYKTSSGKIDLYSQLYKKKGLEPLPPYTPPTTPSNAFRLVVGRNALITQTSTQNNALLCELQADNPLVMPEEAAAKLGLKNGDTVEMKTANATGRIVIRLEKGMEPGTVYMHSGYGTLSSDLTRVSGLCIADFLNNSMDAISGNAAHHETWVSIAKV